MERAQRQFFRIPYRAPDCPVFFCTFGALDVLDISETGLRMATKDASSAFRRLEKLEGELIFPSKRGTFKIESTIVRVTERDVALFFEHESRIPLSNVMEEQRIFIQMSSYATVDGRRGPQGNRRQFFRIFYPDQERPIFSCEAETYKVMDLSEGGLRMNLNESQHRPRKDAVLEGRVILPAKRGVLDVRGVVVRVEDREAAVRFDSLNRIPLARMIEEQRILIRGVQA